RIARDMAAKRAMRLKSELLAKRQRGLSLEDLFARIKEGDVQELNLIVKADVAGSIEAIEQELGKIQHSEVKIRIIHSGVGAITGNDIMLASASSAIVLGFNVRPNTEARVSAEREGVDVRAYTIIYKLREDVELALGGLLRPEEVEEILGEAEVRALFKVSRLGTIAGCMVTSGKIERSARIRLMREGATVYEGEIGSLKRNNDDVREVQSGAECGILIKNFNDVKEGDTIEAFTINQVERDLMSEMVATKA
ncbi:MAG: translation initiation factor IF-2, partial [Thermoleophilia bacterium]|nr:translation initiation factor IF-2 [Thermoleophilia bacterium]